MQEAEITDRERLFAHYGPSRVSPRSKTAGLAWDRQPVRPLALRRRRRQGKSPWGAHPSQLAGALLSRFSLNVVRNSLLVAPPRARSLRLDLRQAPQVPAAPDVLRCKRLQPTEVLSARCDCRVNSGALVAREAPHTAGRSSNVCAT